MSENGSSVDQTEPQNPHKNGEVVSDSRLLELVSCSPEKQVPKQMTGLQEHEQGLPPQKKREIHFEDGFLDERQETKRDDWVEAVNQSCREYRVPLNDRVQKGSPVHKGKRKGDFRDENHEKTRNHLGMWHLVKWQKSLSELLSGLVSCQVAVELGSHPQRQNALFFLITRWVFQLWVVRLGVSLSFRVFWGFFFFIEMPHCDSKEPFGVCLLKRF